MGPYDLALSTGRTTTDPQLIADAQQVIAAAQGQCEITGAFAGNPDLLSGLGPVDLLAVDTDATALCSGAEALFA